MSRFLMRIPIMGTSLIGTTLLLSLIPAEILRRERKVVGFDGHVSLDAAIESDQVMDSLFDKTNAVLGKARTTSGVGIRKLDPPSELRNSLAEKSDLKSDSASVSTRTETKTEPETEARTEPIHTDGKEPGSNSEGISSSNPDAKSQVQTKKKTSSDVETEKSDRQTKKSNAEQQSQTKKPDADQLTAVVESALLQVGGDFTEYGEPLGEEKPARHEPMEQEQSSEESEEESTTPEHVRQARHHHVQHQHAKQRKHRSNVEHSKKHHSSEFVASEGKHHAHRDGKQHTHTEKPHSDHLKEQPLAEKHDSQHQHHAHHSKHHSKHHHQSVRKDGEAIEAETEISQHEHQHEDEQHYTEAHHHTKHRSEHSDHQHHHTEMGTTDTTTTTLLYPEEEECKENKIKFRIKGENGGEKVEWKIQETNQKSVKKPEYALTTTETENAEYDIPQYFYPRSMKANAKPAVLFKTSGGKVDVTFVCPPKELVNIRSPTYWAGWNCEEADPANNSKSSENTECKEVRKGKFHRDASYQVWFLDPIGELNGHQGYVEGVRMTGKSEGQTADLPGDGAVDYNETDKEENSYPDPPGNSATSLNMLEKDSADSNEKNQEKDSADSNETNQEKDSVVSNVNHQEEDSADSNEKNQEKDSADSNEKNQEKDSTDSNEKNQEKDSTDSNETNQEEDSADSNETNQEKDLPYYPEESKENSDDGKESSEDDKIPEETRRFSQNPDIDLRKSEKEPELELLADEESSLNATGGDNNSSNTSSNAEVQDNTCDYFYQGRLDESCRKAGAEKGMLYTWVTGKCNIQTTEAKKEQDCMNKALRAITLDSKADPVWQGGCCKEIHATCKALKKSTHDPCPASEENFFSLSSSFAQSSFAQSYSFLQVSDGKDRRSGRQHPKKRQKKIEDDSDQEDSAENDIDSEEDDLDADNEFQIDPDEEAYAEIDAEDEGYRNSTEKKVLPASTPLYGEWHQKSCTSKKMSYIDECRKSCCRLKCSTLDSKFKNCKTGYQWKDTNKGCNDFRPSFIGPNFDIYSISLRDCRKVCCVRGERDAGKSVQANNTKVNATNSTNATSNKSKKKSKAAKTGSNKTQILAVLGLVILLGAGYFYYVQQQEVADEAESGY